MSKANLYPDDRAAVLFDRFVEAFATCDIERIADLFVTPGVSVRANGETVALTSRNDVKRYYQAVIDDYRREGCRSCQWSHLEVTPIGGRCMMAAVTWKLIGQDGCILATWRQSYNLLNSDDGPKVFASATHVD